ncbi:hypothetical protein [Streptomyces sp. NPDC088762]|uniref:hypothetical protein n=1 Tax=Streptomyces sp. NPDC088762 TaxID=3365891 RepID=UPI0037F151CC
MSRARKSATRAPQVNRPRRGRRRPRPTPVTSPWRETWRQAGHCVALSLAGSVGGTATVVLDWWLRSYL